MKRIFDLAILGGGQYIVLTTLAMFLYPGGAFHDRDSAYYIFSKNFLSDLGRTVAYNGMENTYSSPMYCFTLSFIGVSTLLLFCILPQVFKDDSTFSKFIAWIMVVLGIVAGIGFVGIAFTPSDILRPSHMFFVEWGFKSLLGALFLLMICIYRSPVFPNKYAHLLLATVFLLAGYVLLMLLGPRPYESETALTAQVVGQKIIVYALILGMSIQAYGAKKVFRHSS